MSDYDEKPPEVGFWHVEYREGDVQISAPVRSRDLALDYCVYLNERDGVVERILRPDGMVELDGQELRTAMFAYEKGESAK